MSHKIIWEDRETESGIQVNQSHTMIRGSMSEISEAMKFLDYFKQEEKIIIEYPPELYQTNSDTTFIKQARSTFSNNFLGKILERIYCRDMAGKKVIVHVKHSGMANWPILIRDHNEGDIWYGLAPIVESYVDGFKALDYLNWAEDNRSFAQNVTEAKP